MGGTPLTPGSYSPRLHGRSSPRAPARQQTTAGTAPGSQVGDSRRCAHPGPFWRRGGTAGLVNADSGGLGWAPCRVDQHGRLWGRGNGVCRARAPPLPAGGAPTALCWLGTQDLGPANRARGDNLRKLHLGKSRPLLSAYGGEAELPSGLYITFSQLAVCAKVIAEADS